MNARMRTIFCAWMILLSAGCGGTGEGDTSAGDPADDKADSMKAACTTTTTKRSTPIELWITPEAGDAPMAQVVSGAKKSIRVMVYILDSGAILSALLERTTAGLDVKVILDHSEQSTNQAAFDALTKAGAQVLWSDPQFPYMHAKFLVVDGKEAIVATGNFSKKLIARERNLFSHDRDTKDVADLVALFDADFARKAPTLSCTRLLVSPINSLDRVVALIASAKKSLTVESMQFADSDVRNAVVARKQAGVDVRVLLADPSWIATNTTAAAFLSKNGIVARRMVMPMVHIKNIVVDGTKSYLGSENLSSTSLTQNREVGIVVTDSSPLAAIAASFDRDWNSATPF